MDRRADTLSPQVCTAPAVIVITSNFYTASEQITRVGIWYTCSGVASICGGCELFFTLATLQH